jgi:hypothetical protein
MVLGSERSYRRCYVFIADADGLELENIGSDQNGDYYHFYHSHCVS